MRIRKSATRLLGSAYSASAAPAPGAPAPPELLLTTPPPPPHPAACSPPPESSGWGGYSGHATASGEACELSRSPWDLIAELSLSDPQEDDLVDRYFVHVTTRASWLFSASMPVSNAKRVAAAARERAKRRRDAARRALKRAAASEEKDKKKDAEAWSKAKVKKEEGEQAQAARVWKCKKNDGKRWHCHRTVSQPNTLCSYHFVQKRSYLNPDYEFPGVVEPEEPARPVRAAASKPSGNSKPRRKKPTSDFNATEGFYYYAGFGPFRSKRHCRSGGGTNEPAPVKQEVEPVKQEEEEEEQVPEHASPPASDQLARAAEDANRDAAPHNDVSTCDDDIAGIAGVDEDTSDDYDGIGIASSSVDGDPRASNGGGKRKTPWKRWKRKPVKARSLKSLM